MTSLDFSLHLSAEKVLSFYQGQARTVIARLDDGRTVQFPISAVRKFVTETGIHGRFRITFDEHHKLVGIDAI